jgi:hypothetical protein
LKTKLIVRVGRSNVEDIGDIIIFQTEHIESIGSESSEGFEKNTATSQQEYHIENENNSLIAAEKILFLPQILKYFKLNSDIQFLSFKEPSQP